ncbi:MAG: alpha-galactosidase [Myxococcales bacterium]|nr:MAG: alpha-galactosidase [Myxococcales bacterium]
MSFRYAWVLIFALSLLTACSDDSGSGPSDDDADRSDGILDGDEEQSPDGDNNGENEGSACMDAPPCEEDFDCPESCLCADGACQDANGARFDLVTDQWRLIYRNDLGTVSIVDLSGNWIVRSASASVMLDAPDETGLRLEIKSASERTAEGASVDTPLGENVESLSVTAHWDATAPEATWTLTAYPAGFLTARVTVRNTTTETVQLAKISALTADGQDGGGLFLGMHPRTHRIWENGSYTYLDFYADIAPGDVQRDNILMATVPGDFRGHSVSNWDHAVADLDSEAVWIAGALTFETSSPVFNLSYDPAASVAAPDGRAGFSYFSAEAAYMPHPKPIAAGASQDSELYYLHPTETNVFEGLERWALTAKRQMGIRLWQERDPANRVPNGWNSWTTSGSTGGYGTGIDEDIVLANLDVMATELRDWGIDWFQVDDGYEPYYGDWWWREDKFPHGAAWMADQIRQRGMRPGLWMAPLTLDADSATAQAHPDWLAGRSGIGTFFGTEYKLWDLTHPDVQQYLRDLFTTFRQDWGFEWLKMDFSYYALFGDGIYDPTMTREEAYRGASRIIREALGDDAFFLAVSALGAHFGIVDADRLTLDNMPVWDRQPQDASKGLEQGFKPTVRTAARRYYLHNRLWINHSDLIVFRSNPNDLTWPRVTLSETQAFCTYVGLTGGIVKLGDKLVDLTGEQINTVRKLLPIYDKGGRPLDILTREFPEIWHQPITHPLDGYTETYDLVGLFNWGANVDMSTNPYAEVADTGAPRSFEIDLSSLGLDSTTPYLAYEFWTGEYIGEVVGTLRYDVPSHAGRIIALRRKQDAPQFVGWNRQITMGGVLLDTADWDEEDRTFIIRAKVAAPTAKAPFVYEIAVRIPPGFALSNVNYEGVTVSGAEQLTEGELLRLRFMPESTGDLNISLRFEAR